MADDNKYMTGENGLRIHDVSHNAGVLNKKIKGFVVLVDQTIISSLKINGEATDVKADFGCDVPLAIGAQIKTKDSEHIHEVTLSTTGQINYAIHLNSEG